MNGAALPNTVKIPGHVSMFQDSFSEASDTQFFFIHNEVYDL